MSLHPANPAQYRHRVSDADGLVGAAIGQFLIAATNHDAALVADAQLLGDMVAHCERASPAWPVRLAPIMRERDRCDAILAGPLFTNAAFPWPQDGGKWLEPVLQVDLSVLGALRGDALGSGWLQVWASRHGGMTRVVPAAEVDEASLTALPSERAADYHQRLVETADTGPGWLPGYRIAGFDVPFFDYGRNELFHYVERLLEESESSAPQIRSAAQSLKIAIDEDEDPYGFPTRAFGMINESDIAAVELPPVLFALDEAPPLRQSGHSNDGAYVCFEQNGLGTPTFTVRGFHL